MSFKSYTSTSLYVNNNGKIHKECHTEYHDQSNIKVTGASYDNNSKNIKQRYYKGKKNTDSNLINAEVRSKKNEEEWNIKTYNNNDTTLVNFTENLNKIK